MRRILLAASAAIVVLSSPALAQGRGGGGGGPPAGVGGGPPTSIPAGPPSTLPPGPPDTIPPSANANANASGQVPGNTHAQTDVHASDRAHERTGASVDHSTAASGAGVATRTYKVGQRVPGSATYSTLSAAEMADLQAPYNDTTAYKYILGTSTIYVVNDSTNKVVSVVPLP